MLTPDDFKPPPMRNPALDDKIQQGKAERDAMLAKAIELAAAGTTGPPPGKPDSEARQAALRAHYAGLGLTPREIAGRIAHDLSTAESAAKAIERSRREQEQIVEQQRIRDRGIEQSRDARGLEKQ